MATKNKIRFFTIDFFSRFSHSTFVHWSFFSAIGKRSRLEKVFSFLCACAVAHLARSRQLTTANLRSWSSCWGRWSRERVKLEFQITLFFVCSFAAFPLTHKSHWITLQLSSRRNSKFYLDSTHARARSFSAFSFSKCREEKWKKEPSINFIGKAFSAALDQSRFSQMNNVKKQYKNSRERHWAGREIESDFEKLFFPSIVQLLAMLFKWAVNLKDFKIALTSKQRRGVLLPCLSAGDTHKRLISH